MINASSPLLHRTIGERGDIRGLIEAKANLEERDDDRGDTPLHIAAAVGNVPAVRLLLEARATIQQNSHGETPLHYAPLFDSRLNLKEKEQSMQMLMGMEGVDINGRDRYGNTPLHVAAAMGNVPAVRLLLEARATAQQNNDGENPLHCAAELDAQTVSKDDIVRRLIEAGVALNQETKRGRTPLKYAAESGHVRSVELLLEAKANVNSSGLLHSALYSDNAEAIIPLLITARADVNQRDKDDGETPLAFAVISGKTREVRALLSHRAWVDRKDRWGRTPLILAAMEKQHETMQTLIDAKANVNRDNISGATALHFSAKYQDTVGAKMLLDARADPNWSDERGETPLHIASRLGDTEMVRLLV